MAGHNRWTQIKHGKGREDAIRGRTFSKLANLISAAAKKEANPDFNPTLRSAIERAKRESMPLENIERAIKRAKESGDLEEIIIEAYGPEGAGIIIEGLTDNKPRSLNEIKITLQDHGMKLANPGSLLWSFDKTDAGYIPKFKQEVSEGARQKIANLIEDLENRDEIKEIYSNISLNGQI